MNAITSNLKGLVRFKGRQQRSQFWPYAGTVFAVVMLIGMVLFSIEMSRFFAAMTEFATQNPDSASATSAPPAFAPLFGFTYVMAATLIVLLAAAVSRRLHDSGLRAYWGLMPLPFVAYSLTAMPILLREFERPADSVDVRLFMSIFLSNALYMAALVTLVVLLCRPSAPGTNRYGEQPG